MAVRMERCLDGPAPIFSGNVTRCHCFIFALAAGLSATPFAAVATGERPGFAPIREADLRA